jgi:mRNA-degrading endonuclease RelE of RelBE toxin-antitoxin system
MRIDLSKRALTSLQEAPLSVRKAFHKQVAFLENNLLHPSLHAKKYDETTHLWQARVNRDWRFYFLIKDDAYIITAVIPHPK